MGLLQADPAAALTIWRPGTQTGWSPGHVALVAGAARYRQYDRLTRWIMQLYMWRQGGDTDPSRDYEYTAAPGTASGTSFRLKANEGKSFIGSYVLGMGFVLEPEAAQILIAKDPRNHEALFPYLNGEDLNSRPDQSPSR